MGLYRMKAVRSGNVLEVYRYAKPVLDGYYRNSVPPACKARDGDGGDIAETSMYRTKAAVKRLIWANADRWVRPDGKKYKPIFITFTFAENETNIQDCNRKFRLFIKRLGYYLTKSKKCELQYLTVVEFQARGAVHYHVVFFNLPWMERIYDEMERIWRHGFVIVKTVRGKNGLVKYLSKYFRKELSDGRLFSEKKYFASRGLYRPETCKLKREDKLYIESNEPEFIYAFTNKFAGDVEYRRYQLNDESQVPLDWQFTASE